MADDSQIETASSPAPQAMICTGCQAVLRDEYFVSNGQPLCAQCAATARNAEPAAGGAGRFAKAVLFGLVAAAVGAAVYAGTMILAHAEWALISIAIGWGVGKAVRFASLDRGGWRYQVLAVILTYTSICAAYAAGAWNEIGHPDAEQIRILLTNLFVLPYMGGGQTAIGWLIIGFGLWQAWKSNHPAKVALSGPHPVVGAAA
jgi:hypothetical protein